MTREVVLTETARKQLETAADWYAEQNAAVAARWLNGIVQRLNDLAQNPEQYPIASESEFLPVELRQMLYGSGRRISHRILFVIRERRIVVYQIRHVSMPELTADDL